VPKIIAATGEWPGHEIKSDSVCYERGAKFTTDARDPETDHLLEMVLGKHTPLLPVALFWCSL
jgi:hypothetical protein